MRSRIDRTVAGALVALATAGPLAAQEPRATLAHYTQSLFGRGAGHLGSVVVDVPFVPQGELLCGGAAAAMVMRYHGERGASAESFAPLVRREEGGIRTDELTAELAARGWDVEVRVNDLAGLEAALGAGIPPIVLLESRSEEHTS